MNRLGCIEDNSLQCDGGSSGVRRKFEEKPYEQNEMYHERGDLFEHGFVDGSRVFCAGVRRRVHLARARVQLHIESVRTARVERLCSQRHGYIVRPQRADRCKRQGHRFGADDVVGAMHLFRFGRHVPELRQFKREFRHAHARKRHAIGLFAFAAVFGQHRNRHASRLRSGNRHHGHDRVLDRHAPSLHDLQRKRVLDAYKSRKLRQFGQKNVPEHVRPLDRGLRRAR